MVRIPPRGATPGEPSLGDVATAVDRAKARARGDAEKTPEQAWRDLVEGRVRVVERFERDGRTFVVAQRVGEQRVAAGLTARELSVIERRVRGVALKDIALELGISISTVAKALKRALGKLGLANQAELIAVLGGGCREVGRE